jgi:hypothetical protein
MVSSGSPASSTEVRPFPAPSECSYSCGDGGMHCPVRDPLELILAVRQQRDHWVPSFDEVEARVAHDTICTACGGRLTYVALAASEQAHATAWAICCVCRHWIVL